MNSYTVPSCHEVYDMRHVISARCVGTKLVHDYVLVTCVDVLETVCGAARTL